MAGVTGGIAGGRVDDGGGGGGGGLNDVPGRAAGV